MPIDPTTRMLDTPSMPAVSNFARPNGNSLDGGFRDMLLKERRVGEGKESAAAGLTETIDRR